MLGNPLTEGQTVIVTVLPDEEIVGTVEKVDAMFFTQGKGKIFPYLILNTAGGEHRLFIPLEKITSIVL